MFFAHFARKLFSCHVFLHILHVSYLVFRGFSCFFVHFARKLFGFSRFFMFFAHFARKQSIFCFFCTYAMDVVYSPILHVSNHFLRKYMQWALINEFAIFLHRDCHKDIMLIMIYLQYFAHRYFHKESFDGVDL